MSQPGTDPRDQSPTISPVAMQNVLQAEIGNAQSELRQHQEAVMKLEARIMALRDAQMHADKLAR